MPNELATNLITVSDPVTVTDIWLIGFVDLDIDFAFDFFVVKFGMQHSLACEVSKAYIGFLYVSSDGNVRINTVLTHTHTHIYIYSTSLLYKM